MGNSCCSNKHCQTTKHPHLCLLTALSRAQQQPLRPRQHKERRGAAAAEDRRGEEGMNGYSLREDILPPLPSSPVPPPSPAALACCSQTPSSAPLHRPLPLTRSMHLQLYPV